MKKLIINTVLVAMTLTAVAQTSRRQSNQTRETSRSTESKHNTTVRSNTEQRSGKVTHSQRTYDSKSNQERVVKTQPDRHEKSSGTHQRSHDYNKTNHNIDSQKSRVTYNGNRVYHTDRKYVSPRTYVRTTDHIHQRPSYRTHSQHVYIKRSPSRVNIVWDVHMHRDYCKIYPFVRVWRIPVGTHIQSIGAYDAYFYVGEVKRVYGYVREIYYEPYSDEYHLYLGDYFPFQDFTVVVPGYIARQMSRRPKSYFLHQYIWTTGYITEFDDKPEMIVKRNYQIGIY